MAGAYNKIDSHERECTLRYEALNVSIRDLKDAVIAAVDPASIDIEAGWPV